MSSRVEGFTEDVPYSIANQEMLLPTTVFSRLMVASCRALSVDSGGVVI